jgi:hypothetical protein
MHNKDNEALQNNIITMQKAALEFLTHTKSVEIPLKNH